MIIKKLKYKKLSISLKSTCKIHIFDGKKAIPRPNSCLADSVDDFEARTLVDVANVKGLMLVNWDPPASDVITNLSDYNFSIDLNGVGWFHHLNHAGAVTDLTGLAEAPIIEPKDSGLGLFQVLQAGRRQMFFTFDSFVEELEKRLENTDVTHIVTTGTFDDANSILTTDFLIVALR